MNILSYFNKNILLYSFVYDSLGVFPVVNLRNKMDYKYKSIKKPSIGRFLLYLRKLKLVYSTV